MSVRKRRSSQALAQVEHETSWVHGPFMAMICLSVFFVDGPWAGFHGVLFGLAGLLMWLRPMATNLPRRVWVMVLGFLVLSSASFLPAGWFGIPEWRRQLSDLGVDTGSLVAIQSRQAFETLAMFALMLLVLLWLSGQRAASQTLRWCTLAFTFSVAVYAVISKFVQEADILAGALDGGHFGFFPNRNHSATYLAMGAICGLGSTLQAGRDRHRVTMVCALIATAVIFCAIFSWSISRGGVVLVALGMITWLILLGRRYLGRNGLWAIALILIGVIGSFVIVESSLKNRLSETMSKATAVVDFDIKTKAEEEKSELEALERLDFRVSVYRDALDMIGAAPLTGVGAGQFHDVFPQFRKRTIGGQDTHAHHPDNDWLWLAAELGVPATLVLLGLLLSAAIWVTLAVLEGRDRALRAACLVSALLVPLHGCFDVPGHRISILWTGALLFSLSIPAQVGQQALHRWPSRLMGGLLLIASAFLVHAQWLGGRPPAVVAAQSAIQKVQALYKEDLALQKVADAKGLPHQPAPDEDLLVQALQILDDVKAVAPLNREIYRHEAFLALHFHDKADRVETALGIDWMLNPHCVLSPLRQGETWSQMDAMRAKPFFAEALRRSKELEQLEPNHRWNRTKVREYIKHVTRHHSEPNPKMAENESPSPRREKRPNTVILSQGFPLGHP